MALAEVFCPGLPAAKRGSPLWVVTARAVFAARTSGVVKLADLGDALAKAKLTAPKKPHPRSPDEPPMNAVGVPA
jgi:hypothetical protein